MVPRLERIELASGDVVFLHVGERGCTLRVVSRQQIEAGAATMTGDEVAWLAARLVRVVHELESAR